jgi:integrase/recombinase XerD
MSELVSSNHSIIPSTAQELGIFSDEHLITLFLQRPRPKPWSEKTKRAYTRDLQTFLKFIEGTPLREVTYVQLVAYCQSLSHYSAATQQRMINVMRSLFLFAHRLGYIQRNPAILIAAPRTPNRATHRRSLQPEEAQRLLDQAAKEENTRVYLLVAVLLTTGARVEELCQAKWCDLYQDMHGNIGWMIKGKGAKERSVVIREDVFELLCRNRAEAGLSTKLNPRDTSPLVFTSKGTHYRQNGVRDILYRLSMRAGLHRKISPHILRHTCATFALDANAPLLQVQKQLGHESLRTTERYLHDLHALDDGAGKYINQVKI